MLKQDLVENDIVFAVAWWDKDRLIKCRIHSMSSYDCLVCPLEGNPHSHYVYYDKIERKQ